MNRPLAAVLIGLLSFLYIADVAAGYLDFARAPSLGELSPINGYAQAYRTVTPAGAAAGIRPGDILDARILDTTSRAVILSGLGAQPGSTYDYPLERSGHVVHARVTFERRPAIWLDLVDVIMRIMLAAAGVFLIARGTARDSLYGGIFVCSLSVNEGFAVHLWGPSWLTLVLAVFVGIIASAGTFGVRLLFAFSLMPKDVPRILYRLLAWVGGAAFALFMVLAVLRRSVYFTGYTPFTILRPYTIFQMAVGYSALAVFATAAFYARGKNAAAVRWAFAAMAISLTGVTINWIATLTGTPLPASGALNVTYMALAIILPYAVLARGLVAVDFVFSRAVIYAIVLSVIVGVFILAEQVIEKAALGRVQSFIFELLVPLVLGLSVKWIESWAEGVVERVLYRDKLRAAEEMDALISDFPHARDVRALAVRVANEIHRQMLSLHVCVYRETESTYSPIAQAGLGDALPVDADDPVFMRLRSKQATVHTDDFATALPRHGAVFPLVVFGSVTGAVYARYRESGERFDPDELKTLARLAHELAIALLWVERAPAESVA